MLLAGWSTQVRETGEMLILLAGSILLCVGVSHLLELSPLIASLAVGATMVNLSRRSRPLFTALAGTDPPFYAIFFVLAGADLDLALVPAMGVVGTGLRVRPLAGQVLRRRGRRALAAAGIERPALPGFRTAGASRTGGGPGHWAIEQRYEAFGPSVSTVVLASVAIFEMIGPISARFALIRSGEADTTGLERAPV